MRRAARPSARAVVRGAFGVRAARSPAGRGRGPHMRTVAHTSSHLAQPAGPHMRVRARAWRRARPISILLAPCWSGWWVGGPGGGVPWRPAIAAALALDGLGARWMRWRVQERMDGLRGGRWNPRRAAVAVRRWSLWGTTGHNRPRCGRVGAARVFNICTPSMICRHMCERFSPGDGSGSRKKRRTRRAACLCRSGSLGEMENQIGEHVLARRESTRLAPARGTNAGARCLWTEDHRRVARSK